MKARYLTEKLIGNFEEWRSDGETCPVCGFILIRERPLMICNDCGEKWRVYDKDKTFFFDSDAQ